MTPDKLIELIEGLNDKDRKKVAKALKLETTDSKRKARDAAEEIKLQQQRVDLRIQELEIEQKQMAALGEVNNALQKQFQIRDALEEKKDIAAQNVALMKKLQKKALEEELSAEDEKTLKKLENAVKERDAILELIDKIDKQTEGIERLTEAQEAAKEEFDEFFTGIGTHLGVLSPTMNRYLKTTTKIGELAKKNPEQVAQAMRDAFSPTKLLLGLTMQIYEATMKHALAVDKATAAFAAQTGAGRALTQQIASVGSGFRNLGIGAADAGKAAEQLFGGFAGFMQMSRDGQEDLMQTVAALEKIGVNGQDAVASLELLTKNFSLSTGEATRMTKQLSIAGTKIGISASKMMNGFVAASKSLAVYGKDAIKVFTDLAAQARAASVETSTLLGIADQFDTFSGAADATGKLNSILGTQISAIDMLTMKENERIETLIRSIQAQGRSFKDMDRFSQKAIANAAGISDMAEAQRIFSMNVNDYRKGLKSSQAEEEFNKRLKESMDIYKKLEMAFQNFAIQVGPFVDKIAAGVQAFLDFSQEMQGAPAMIVLGGVALLGFMLVLAQLTPLLGLLGVAGPAAGAGLSGLGAGAAAAIPGLSGIIMPLLGVAAAFAILAGALSLMGKLGGGKNEGIFATLVGLAAGLVALGAAAAVLGVMSIFIGVGALALGAFSLGVLALGIALATIQLEKLEALSSLMQSLSGGVESKFTLISDVSDFTEQLVAQEATLRPMLGDLALITTGRTSEGITASTTNTAFQQFSANFKNIFKPEITIKVGETELRGIIQDEIAKNSREVNK